MMLEEANERLEKFKITEDELWELNALYILLDLHKNDFCKIIDVVGKDKLLSKHEYYERLQLAERELSAKERYLKAKVRLAGLETEKEGLNALVNSYKLYEMTTF